MTGIIRVPLLWTSPCRGGVAYGSQCSVQLRRFELRLLVGLTLPDWSAPRDPTKSVLPWDGQLPLGGITGPEVGLVSLCGSRPRGKENPEIKPEVVGLVLSTIYGSYMKKGGKPIPDFGTGKRRDGRGIVPAPPTSTSSVGLEVEFVAGSSSKVATDAEVEIGKEDPILDRQTEDKKRPEGKKKQDSSGVGYVEAPEDVAPKVGEPAPDPVGPGGRHGGGIVPAAALSSSGVWRRGQQLQASLLLWWLLPLRGWIEDVPGPGHCLQGNKVLAREPGSVRCHSPKRLGYGVYEASGARFSKFECPLCDGRAAVQFLEDSAFNRRLSAGGCFTVTVHSGHAGRMIRDGVMPASTINEGDPLIISPGALEYKPRTRRKRGRRRSLRVHRPQERGVDGEDGRLLRMMFAGPRTRSTGIYPVLSGKDCLASRVVDATEFKEDRDALGWAANEDPPDYMVGHFELELIAWQSRMKRRLEEMEAVGTKVWETLQAVGCLVDALAETRVDAGSPECVANETRSKEGQSTSVRRSSSVVDKETVALESVSSKMESGRKENTLPPTMLDGCVDVGRKRREKDKEGARTHEEVLETRKEVEEDGKEAARTKKESLDHGPVVKVDSEDHGGGNEACGLGGTRNRTRNRRKERSLERMKKQEGKEESKRKGTQVAGSPGSCSPIGPDKANLSVRLDEELVGSGSSELGSPGIGLRRKRNVGRTRRTICSVCHRGRGQSIGCGASWDWDRSRALATVVDPFRERDGSALVAERQWITTPVGVPYRKRTYWERLGRRKRRKSGNGSLD
ncbi:hypothetical protein EAI_15536 [Harpegnathos saltator]|uniref:Uncharacterized protein n=1 Tax=Harpegnathos saltator TaxID=610380 RepID=E2CA80_HARSA|nr:hypothetical protein EAI_15536 [Harpegnathos saltator]